VYLHLLSFKEHKGESDVNKRMRLILDMSDSEQNIVLERGDLALQLFHDTACRCPRVRVLEKWRRYGV
jgi:hypothetical protein